MSDESKKSDIELIIKELIEHLKQVNVSFHKVIGILLYNETVRCHPETFLTLKKQLDVSVSLRMVLEDYGLDLWGGDDTDVEQEDSLPAEQ